CPRPALSRRPRSRARRSMRQAPRTRFRDALRPPAAPSVVPVLYPSARVDKRLSRRNGHGAAGWVMCKLTKTDSAVLSWYLETQYVNEVTARGYAVAPNLDLPLPSRSKAAH